MKSKRKPGKSAHVAVDVNLAAVRAARLSEAASRIVGLSLCDPRRQSVIV